MFDRDYSVYLDTEFVVRKYEQITGSASITSITKADDVPAEVARIAVCRTIPELGVSCEEFVGCT